MTNQVSNDPWESADNPQLRAFDYWGVVTLSMYFAILQKGIGKVPFDPQVHSLDQRVTVIEILLSPLAEQNVSRPPERSMIAESKEWAGFVLPSIKALGISARELNGKYVRAHMKPTGETYTKNDETKDKSTFEFLKIFPSEDECRKDYLASKGSNGSPTPAAVANGGNGSNKEKETAAKFLPVIVANAVNGQKDLEVIRKSLAVSLASYSQINKFFTVDSPQVMTLIMEKMAGGK